MIYWIKTLIVYTFPAITLIGLVTNSISFAIFSRKRFKNTIFSTYLRCFIICQSINLILPINKMFELNLDTHFGMISNFFCKLRYFYAGFNFSNAAWILVVISIDRFLSIAYPVKFQYRKKTSFQLSICFSVILLNICLSTPAWFYHIAKRTTTSKISNDTSVSCAPYSLWVDIFEILHQIMIPFVLMFLFTFMMVKYVFKSRIKTTNFSTSSSNTSSNDRKFAISSTTINIMFLLFNFPHFVMYFFKQYSNLYQNSLELFSLLEAFTYFLLYVNLITTFFINYIVNSMFKSEFEIMFNK